MPTALGVAAVVMAAAGTAVSTYSSIKASEAQEQSARVNSSVSAANAQMAESQAKFNAEAIRKKNRLMLARTRSSIMKSGMGLGGTGEDLILSSAAEGELNALSTLYSGYVQGKGYKMQSKLYSMQADNSDGTLAAAGTALSGASSTVSAANNARANNPSFQ